MTDLLGAAIAGRNPYKIPDWWADRPGMRLLRNQGSAQRMYGRNVSALRRPERKEAPEAG